MCDEPNDVNISNSFEGSEVFKLSVNNSFEDDLKDLPEILLFIKRLQDCIIRQRTIIGKLCEKFQCEKKKYFEELKDAISRNKCNAETQTYNSDFPEDAAATTYCETNDDEGSIVQKVKEIAESAVRQTGFVYEASSGMYYDYNTGYYYNAELGLYYDGNSGSYLSYDETNKTFHYHSSVTALPNENDSSNNSVKLNEDNTSEDVYCNPMTKSIITEERHNMEVEEGECIDDVYNSDNGDSKEDDIRLKNFNSNSERDPIIPNSSSVLDITKPLNLDEIASGWPPCMRIVVQDTCLENLTVGTLFIVTCSGGSLGREGNHSVTIPDITISKHHASFKFCEERKCYTVVDLGSRNGTFLNGNRLSVALQESPPHPIEHGMVLRVGSTNLLCHIHEGRETCNECEPGCMTHCIPEKNDEANRNKQVKHRSELRRLRRKFGLDGPGGTVRVNQNISSSYQDRAEARRKNVGSSHDNEKTEVASVFESIKSDNKGFKMMAKMGWAEGQVLGKDSKSDSAISQPIIVEQRPDKAGLGSSEAGAISEESNTKRKNIIWKKTLKRFNDSS